MILQTHLNSTIEHKLWFNFNWKTINEVLSELSVKTDIISLDKCGQILGQGIPKAHVTEFGLPCVRYETIYSAP